MFFLAVTSPKMIAGGIPGSGELSIVRQLVILWFSVPFLEFLGYNYSLKEDSQPGFSGNLRIF